jgi:long-chain acyl-CoA synthetase
VKPWLAHYDADVAQSIAPYPNKTLVDYLADLSRAHGDRPAVLFKGSAVSYGMLESQSDAFAAALTALGVRPGDRVAIVLPNCPQFMVAEFGIWKTGGVVVALNPIYSERELEAALVSTGAVLAIILTPFYNRIKAIQPRTRLQGVIATSIKEYLPPLLRLLFTLFKEQKDGHRVLIAANDYWFQELLRAHQTSPCPSVDVHPDDRAVILSSGGTPAAAPPARRKVSSAFTDITLPPVCSFRSGRSRPCIRPTRSCCRCRSSTCMPMSACRRWRW